MSKRGFRLVHFSVQHDHLHLLAEALERERVARAMQGFGSSSGRVLNRIVGRRGPLWRDRYHDHELTTPLETRRALVYVVMNFRKHARTEAEIAAAASGLDPYSSAAALPVAQWSERSTSIVRAHVVRCLDAWGEVPVVAPHTYLLRTGWLRRGALSWDERPKSAP
jgi:putative transposase